MLLAWWRKEGVAWHLLNNFGTVFFFGKDESCSSNLKTQIQEKGV